MALSKSSRIIILLVIDSLFFFLELIVGYAVHSLALVADSFHMLNDVLSLCVGLWAVKVANSKPSSKMYTYGWQRAETLGALVNGVFLVALCVTIFLEAVSRFVEPQEVSQPKLILIVGCLGLASNIVGLLLFHDHSHGHGGGGHSHGPHDAIGAAEEGHSHSHSEHETHSHAADQSRNTADTSTLTKTATLDSDNTTVVDRERRHSRSKSRAYSGFDDIHVNPNRFRQSIIDAGRLEEVDTDESTDGEIAADDDENDTHDHTRQPLLHNGKQSAGYGSVVRRKSIDHKKHKHAQPKEQGKGHGHSHGDLNMRGIFLHVMGDALGNIGVIATALVIWLTDYSWRFRFDPAISLLIAIIILCSALPLCKAASRILLQAVPAGISVDDIKEDIEDLPGIISCHHLHVWQLSDTKLVASLHVQVEFDFKAEGSARYMELAQAIRKCLHEYGIHSSTIQPEFCLDPDHDHSGQDVDGDAGGIDSPQVPPGGRPAPTNKVSSKPGSVREPDTCLLECGEDCEGDKSCCPPAPN